MVHEMWTPIAEEFDDYISRPSPTATARCTRWWLTTTAGRSRCRSARARCTSSPSTAWPRTGATRKPAPRAGRSPRPASTTGSCRGCASCWPGTARSRPAIRPRWLRPRWNRPGRGERGAGKTRQAAAEPTQSDERIYVMMPQARDRAAGRRHAGGFRLSPAHRLGHRCRGARVDGQMVPLQTRLSTGQTVEIISAKSGGPSRDWLNPQLGFLASPRARSKVRMWFNAIELQQRITQGQALVERNCSAWARPPSTWSSWPRTWALPAPTTCMWRRPRKNSACGRSTRCSSSPRRPQSPYPRPLRGASAESAEKSGKSGVLVVGGFAADAAGALLPPGAAGRHRRLCHPRPRRVHPSSRLSQLPGAGRARAGTRHRGGLGRDLGHVLSGGHQRARTTVPAAARPVGSVRAAAPEWWA